MNYENYLNQYIEDQRKDLDKLKSLRPDSFRHIRINCSDLTKETSEGVINQLIALGVNKESSIIYYMEVEGDKDSILKVVSRLKARKRKKIMLPLINKEQFEAGTNILYIGKTNNNFLSRMSYHLGLKSENTYALHLMKWACELDLVINLYFATVDIDKKDIKYLELMEGVMHHCLKPLLGRSGH